MWVALLCAFESHAVADALTTGQGNEHVTIKYPDGREKYTFNGVEQDTPTVPPSRYIGPSSYPDMHRDARRSNTAPAPGPPPQPIAYHTPPPPYASRSVYDPLNRHHRHGNGASCFSLSSSLCLLLTWPLFLLPFLPGHQEGYPVIPTDASRHDDDQASKRRWPFGW
jgi:hypothetical protein